MQVPFLGIGIDVFGYAVSRKDDYGAFRDLVNFIDKDDALALEGIDHELIVYDFVAHIDRSTKLFESFLDHMYSTVHAGTETAGRSKD
jgi:hypothetical protein